MNVVGKVGSLISQGVYSVATPFHPFGGAVDVIVVQQQDGTFRSTPWYVRFGKFQGVLKGAEKIVKISVNGVDANFHMYLDNSGEAYFVRETETDGVLKGSDSLVPAHENSSTIGSDVYRLEHSVSDSGVAQLQDEYDSGSRLERTESDCSHRYYDFDEQEGSEYESSRYENLDEGHFGELQGLESEVVLVSVDGHILTAPVSSSLEHDAENVQLSTPQFHLGPGEGPEFCEGNAEFSSDDSEWAKDYISKLDSSVNVKPNKFLGINIKDDISGTTLAYNRSGSDNFLHSDINTDDIFGSCLELSELSQNEFGEMSPVSADQISREASTQTLVEDEKAENGDIAELGTNSRLSRSCSYKLLVETGSKDTDELQSKGKHGQVEDKQCSDTASVDFTDEQMLKDEQSKTSAETNRIDGDPHGSGTKVEHGDGVISEADRSQVHDGTRPFEISLCRSKLHPGMGLSNAAQVFDAHQVSVDEYKLSSMSILKNDDLVVRVRDKYLTWDKAAPVVLGKAIFDIELSIEPNDVIPVELDDKSKTKDGDTVITTTSSGRRWRLWPIPFRRVKTMEHTSPNSSNEEVFVDPEPDVQSSKEETAQTGSLLESPRKQLVRTNVPTSEQIASLNLIEGQNLVTFSFSTRVLGRQQVDAHIYLWKWNARIVISDVDGTITKSDVLGQFMPLVGKDWTQSGVARLFSAIKENGYQLLFLSARAIVQAYLTRSFLLNLKQDGKALPNGPVVISPDGLFPALYREVIRRAPHEFKIACLEDIKKLFPPDYNPFYAGFGNRDTDELSYRKIGIPKGKIFIINPKGEVATSHRIDVKSYTSLHTLVNDMFPPTALVEQEDFNSWNYWKMPLEEID